MNEHWFVWFTLNSLRFINLERQHKSEKFALSKIRACKAVPSPNDFGHLYIYLNADWAYNPVKQCRFSKFNDFKLVKVFSWIWIGNNLVLLYKERKQLISKHQFLVNMFDSTMASRTVNFDPTKKVNEC